MVTELAGSVLGLWLLCDPGRVFVVETREWLQCPVGSQASQLTGKHVRSEEEYYWRLYIKSGPVVTPCHSHTGSSPVFWWPSRGPGAAKPPLYSIKDTAQGSQSPLTGALVVFHRVAFNETLMKPEASLVCS